MLEVLVTDLAPPADAFDELLARAEARGRPAREVAGVGLGIDYDPWYAQVWLHRCPDRIRMVVAGRGAGKTHGCAKELLQIVLEAKPGSEGAVLAPTYTHAEAAEKALVSLAENVPGSKFLTQKKRLLLPGGRSIRIYSADRKETVRGPSLVAIWIDEGAYLRLAAVEAALPALRSGQRRDRGLKKQPLKILVSTTPAGKNWAYLWWEKATPGAPNRARFRFRSIDSPYQDPEMIEEARQLMGEEKFAQEYLAEFVDNLLLVFPDREGLFVAKHPTHTRKPLCWLGVDLGKIQDWTVLVLMNEHGETWVVGRWKLGQDGMESATFWGETDRRVIEEAKRHGAMVVIDTGGAGGSAGAVMAENLRKLGIPVMEVKTNNPKVKAEVVEQLNKDVHWRAITIEEGAHTRQLDYEMSRFQGIKRIEKGEEVTKYEGPQVPGEHDDCVIALALANWGRSRDDDPEPGPLDHDLSSFFDPTKPQGGSPGGFGAVGGGGYSL